MKKWELILLVALCLSIILTSFSSFSNVCASVREDTLRLHILANSDTEGDQAAKLAVRDEILKAHGEMFAESANKQGAIESAKEALSDVAQTATKALRANSMSYSASAEIVEMYFDTTQYESFTMPAGRYKALRIKLGEAKGKNWFCVMFPPLCLPAAQDSANTYTDIEQATVRTPYKIKFAIIEWFMAASEGVVRDDKG